MNCRFNLRWVLSGLLASGVTAPFVNAQDKWTDSTGVRTIEGHFVELNGVQLKLKKLDGGEVVLPLYKLDEASRKLARLKAQAALNADPAASAAGDGPVATASNTLPLSLSTEPVIFPEGASLQEHFQQIENEYKKGNYLVDWDSIPAPYQGVIQDYFATAIGKLDPAVVQELVQLKQRWEKTLKSKRDMILSSQVLSGDEETKALAQKLYDPLVNLLVALPPREGFDPAVVKSAPLRDTMKTWIEELLPLVDQIVQVVPGARENFFAARPQVDQMKFISINADSARVSLTPPGRPTVTTEWGKFEKRWVRNDYQKTIDDIYFANEKLQKEDAAAFNNKVRQWITAGSLAAGVLEASETQSDIDDVLRGAKSSVRALLPLLQRGMNLNNGSSAVPSSSGYPQSSGPGSPYQPSSVEPTPKTQEQLEAEFGTSK